MKDIAKATKDASDVVAINSSSREGWNLLGLIAQAKSDSKSQEYFDKANDLKPSLSLSDSD